MSTSFLHGIEVIEINDGPRPIRTVTSSVIGLVGTAPQADAKSFPVNTPISVRISQTTPTPSGLGSGGTLLPAIEGISKQISTRIVVVRVEEGTNASETQSNVIGSSLTRSGVWALTGAQSTLGVQPRIIISPGLSSATAVTTELVSVANRLRAIAIADGPNTTDVEAINFSKGFGSDRLYIVDPQVQVLRGGITVNDPASAYVAGVIARTDADHGFWWSPSNKHIEGITGLARPIDFGGDDRNTSANLLNENKIATIIREGGFRLWGNRSVASDPKYSFLSVRRTADMIFDSIRRNHFWAVDRNITKTYFDHVSEGVNTYMRDLQNLGAIYGGSCWPNKELNSSNSIEQGIVYFDFDFYPPTPAEHVVFRGSINHDYIKEILK